MKKDYFNKLEFVRSLNLIEKNPKIALKSFENYLEEYPEDYCSYSFYISVLTEFGLVSKAKEIMEQVFPLANGNSRFKYKSGRYEYFLLNMLYTKIKMLAYLEKYDEILLLYNEHAIFLENSNIDFSQLIFYSKKNLGIAVDSKSDGTNSYLYKQMDNYSEKAFLEHINKHLADYNMDSNNPNPCLFSSDFPLNEVLTEIKKYIPSSKGLFVGFLDNTYIFKFDYCGRVNNRITDYFKVVCLHNTDKIITIYPVIGYENWEYTDINYIKGEDTLDEKKYNMTEKFYKRYGMNH